MSPSEPKPGPKIGYWAGIWAYLALALFAHGQNPEQQSWTALASPTTHDLWGVTSDGEENFYAVGQGGTILSSTGGLQWKVVASGTTNWLLGVTFTNLAQGALTVVVGDQGLVLESADGVVWTQRFVGTSRLNGVAFGGYSNSVILAVGEGGAVARSTDGISWTSGNAGVSGWLRGIVYANNQFLVAGQGGVLLSTTDGIKFTALNSGTTADIESIAYGDGIYVVAGSGGYLADSPDGMHWTVRTPPAATDLRSVATFGTQGLAVGSAGSLFATNLGQIDWLLASNAVATDLYAVTATPPLLPGFDLGGLSNKAVAVGQGGVIAAFAYAGYLPNPSLPGIRPPLTPLLGGTVQVTATIGGQAPLSLQWSFNNQPIPGATSATLTIPNAQMAQNGNYTLRVTNAYGVSNPTGFSLNVTYDPVIPNFVDESFNPGSALTSASIAGMTVQPDGRILIVSPGLANDAPVRLNADGTSDPTFQATAYNPMTDYYSFELSGLLLQPDGRMIVTWSGGGRAGQFADSRRLNPDGSIDASYTPHTVVAGGIDPVVEQDAIPQILLGNGQYLAWSPSGVVRLTTAGALDSTYTPVTLSQLDPALPEPMLWQSDSVGRVLLGVPGPSLGQSAIYRFNADGTLDPTFAPAVLPGVLLRLHVQPSGKVVYETMAQAPSNVAYAVGRLATDGTSDGSYSGLTLTNPSPSETFWTVGPSVFTSDGSVFVDITGNNLQLPLVKGTYRQGIVRIDPNGNFDPSFKLNFGAASSLTGLALQPDGKVLAWGSFPYFNGEARTNFLRLQLTAGANFPSLANISARAQLGSGNPSLIVGFVVNSATTKMMLLRGIGPGLTAFGVAGALPNPQLDYYGPSGALLLADDNWQDNGNGPAIAGAAARLGGFALANGSLDAAILAPVASGASSFAVTDVSGASGIALAEAYDADPMAPSYGGSRVVNFSCRGFSGSGANGLITGFVVGGANTKQVLIRAIGPTLANYGVSGALADPVLTIYQGGTAVGLGTVGQTTGLNQTAQLVGAFALPAQLTKDSALAITLAPGPYTAEVTSASGASGIVLLEVYEVP